MCVFLLGFKTWTLDSGLDYGLDYELDYGLDYRLDFGLNFGLNFELNSIMYKLTSCFRTFPAFPPSSFASSLVQRLKSYTFFQCIWQY